MKELSFQDIEDILLGCTILGTGGGGEMEEGLGLMREVYDAGHKVKLATFDEAPDDALICTPYLLGALDLREKQKPEYQRLPQSPEPAITAAYRKLETLCGDRFFGTVCCEMGGANTAVAFYTAAMHGAVVIDADPAGRAVPEITHSTYYLNNLPVGTLVAANEFGETFVVENVSDDLRAEQLMRAICQESANDIAVVDHAMRVDEIKGALIHGTITKALTLGRAVRVAKEEGVNVAKEIARLGEGNLIFTGEVAGVSYVTEKGFTVGAIDIAEDAKHDSNRFRIEVKNENMAGYRNGKIAVTIPELICLIDEEAGLPITNPNCYVGQKVAVVVLPAPKEFTTPRGLSVFGPAYLGLNMPFKPTVQ